MKNWIFILFFGFANLINAQNLIPNPGFDIISDCPFEKSQIEFAVKWKSANYTPDLYNICSTSFLTDIPNAGITPSSYQEQRSGNGFAGIYTYNDLLQEYEYLEAPLINQLKENKDYYIEFFISPDTPPEDKFWCYSDAVGLSFTDTFYVFDGKPTSRLIPIIENRGTLIKDSVGWTRVSGCYTAKGGEKYATIGNFRTASETLIEIQDPNYGPNASYFFIEDVLVQQFDPLPDTLLLCDDDPKTFNAGFLYATYLWNIGSTDSTLTLNKAGTYTIEATMENCTLRDTLIVIDTREVLSFQTDTTICADEPFTLHAPLSGIYKWSNGAVSQNIEVKNDGFYAVTVSNECGEFIFSTQIEVKECGCDFFVPNAINADANNINGILQAFTDCDYEYQIKTFAIFDRWGNHIYAANNGEEIKWDGTYKGKALETGVYIWYLDYEFVKDGKTEHRIKRGDVSILR
jgi:gliding motility-associated-like protein